ncbi:MAG: calcium-translocating P-type ATPase, PMCA-type [Bacilli bacterium]
MFDSKKNGLTDEEVIENRKKYGSNQIKKIEKPSFLKKLLETLGDPIIRILLIALGIKTVFLIKNFDWYETVGIVIAIFISSFISTISEIGSEQAFNKMQEVAEQIKCNVIRNKNLHQIHQDEVVVNDVVVLNTGDKIPADGILIEGEISVDESFINGEAKEIYKLSVNNHIIEKNKLYKGSVVYSNNGKMLVTKVGKDTFYGQIASELCEKSPESPLKNKLKCLAQTISKIGYFSAFLVTISYLFSVIVIQNQFNFPKIIESITNVPLMMGYILYALTLSVTIIVVAVPEGLPMMITLVLSSNMKRMLKKNVLVRKMVGIETAGSINVLFTDKTGTLTKGNLEVIGLVDGNLNKYPKEEEIKKFPTFYTKIKQSLILNNDSKYDINNNVVGGNLTDRSLLRFLKPDYINFSIIEKIAFDSKNKYSSVIVKDKERIQFIKGAPERIIPYCKNYLGNDGITKLFYNKKRINDYILGVTKQGVRIIALALNDNDKLTTNFENLTFLGLVLIKDEIRKSAKDGIALVKKANIQTIMITGDNKETAVAIGKELGLYDKSQDIVLTTNELYQMTDTEIKDNFNNIKIIARALPQDKSRLVKIARELNLVVGMTGDGVNDAPALKKADVGFAMGSGTEVAKEASDIVILDDNFISISNAILFGRTIFKSIRKFIIFQLTVNMCAISLSIIGPFIGVNAPVTVIQMLWINMIMDTLAGLAFSFEPPLLEYMEEQPKKKDENIINKYMKNEIIFTGLYSSILCILFLKLPFFQQFFRDGVNEKYFMTAFFGVFIFIGLFNCFNARTHRLNLITNILKNKVFILTIIFIFVVQILLIYYGGTLFRTSGLTFKELEIMLLISITVIPVDWIRKIILRKKGIIGGV